jgi:LPS O-antigen subunit length determinant protein (WzzB/FepE family)
LQLKLIAPQRRLINLQTSKEENPKARQIAKHQKLKTRAARIEAYQLQLKPTAPHKKNPLHYNIKNQKGTA